MSAAKRFSRQLDMLRDSCYFTLGNGGRGFVAVTVIVIFEIFKNITDVQEGVAVQADIDECRLHAGKNAGDSAFVDAADEGEFFFALDINFY